ncbi:MAG: ribosome-associated translation inhibitor RaiA [Bacteroidota bacterium]|nr:ribosome-associated translation inhibitor RaiA [Bacteroidota bacterium]MDP4195592.1 ribosome-associated translation inhibitor RaiA [Bacteroidota bacterium]
MNIQITSRKFKAKESLKDFIHAELGSLEKLNYDIKSVDVVLSYENVKDSTKIAEIVLQIPGRVCTAKESSDDFEKSVAIAIQKIEKQLTRVKTKRIDTKRTDVDIEEIQEESSEENEIG